MEKLLFTFLMTAAAEKKTNVIKLTAIETSRGNRYKIPPEYQEIVMHKELCKTKAVEKVKKTLTHRQKYLDNINRRDEKFLHG